MTKLKPILFSTEMVQAILEGRKTMTRRTKGLEETSLLATEIVRSDQWKKQGDWVARFKFKGKERYEITNIIKYPYGKVGDIFWVRETYSPGHIENGSNTGWQYKADNKGQNIIWKPSIFMPKEAARIFLKVTNIRVERLHDITEEDAIAEGIKHLYNGWCLGRFVKDDPNRNFVEFFNSPIAAFESLWNTIKGEASWKENPYVWVIEFERVAKPENL